MKIPFTKMHGLGNDYVYIDCFAVPFDTLPDPSGLAVRMSSRRFAVGADGLVLILPSDVADARMRMFNADGSEGLMCGNAIRCVGKYLYERGYLLPERRELTVETGSGIKRLLLEVADGKVQGVTVDMGQTIVGDARTASAMGAYYPLLPVSVGNPHAVCFLSDVSASLSDVDADTVGAVLSASVAGGVNVEFVEVVDRTTLRMRVCERGSGVTLACGTGACATVAAAVHRGICVPDTPVTVLLDGGSLTVTLTDGGTAVMTGPATHAFDGVWEE